MNKLEASAAWLVLAFGGIALFGGILNWSISAVVMGCLQILAALWFRRSLKTLSDLRTNSEIMIDTLGFIARSTRRKEREEVSHD